MSKKRTPYVQVYEREWTEPLMHYDDQCCDCGLVHKVRFKIIKGKVSFWCRIDKRATASVRRAKRLAHIKKAIRKK